MNEMTSRSYTVAIKFPVALHRRGDIIDYVVEELFQTDEFKDSAKERDGFIYNELERFAYIPRVFTHETSYELERGHFSTWWNAITLRPDYSNPYINDLYYLHEIGHASRMPYLYPLEFEAFDEKMQRNELEASVLSEIEVYFQIDGLRENSFPHPIYADRFLEDDAMVSLWRASPQTALETMRTHRRNTMRVSPEHLTDFSDRWLRRFADQNRIFAGVWSHRYGDIEAHMKEMVERSCGGDRRGALHFHQAWLESEASRGRAGIPFTPEAEMFAPIYWANKKRYEEEREQHQQ
jgi:hypothetical protein